MGTTIAGLTSLFGIGSDTSGTAGLLNTLYGQSAQKTNLLGQNPVTALLSAELGEKQQVKATAAQPMVQRAVNAFRTGVANAKTVDQLLSNPAVMQVLLTANGLGDQTAYTALAKRALTSKLSDPKSLANAMTDTRWKQVAATYNFAAKGLKVIQDPKVIDTVANAYAEVTWRQALDKTTPGLSNAIAFRAQAATVTSVDQILGDPVLREVVTVALSVPKQIAFQPLEAQEKAISSRLDLTKFKDPKYVESFTQRYLIAAGNNAATSGTGAAADLTSLAVKVSGLTV